MSQLQDFAEYFKSRKVMVEAWLEDDVGRYAFRVTVDGTTFYASARSNSGKTTSVMKKLCGKAQTYGDDGALILLRVGDDIRVYDPVTILAHGREFVKDDERKKRGEEWFDFPIDYGVPFEDYVDGFADPPAHDEVTTTGDFAKA